MLTQLMINVWHYLITTDEEGQGMAEYALIIALVAIVLAASLTSLQGGIAGVFTRIITAFGN